MSEEKTPTRNIPVGVERVLYAAALDGVFRDALLGDRERSLNERDFSLRGSERTMLLAIPRTQLEATIDSLDVSPVNVKRRRFLGAVALSTVTVAIGGGGCGDDEPETYAGVRPRDSGMDIPDQGLDAVAGVRDMPPLDDVTTDVSVKDSWPTFDSTGIRPKD